MFALCQKVKIGVGLPSTFPGLFIPDSKKNHKKQTQTNKQQTPQHTNKQTNKQTNK